MEPLPKFRDHGADVKFYPLDEEQLKNPTLHTRQFISMLEIFAGKDIAGLKILDFGCGRGELTGTMRRMGADAYGVEVSQKSIDCGTSLLKEASDDLPFLSLLDENGRSLFPDAFFDIVISDQVLEHVSDLPVVFAEIKRVLKPGGLTINQFPAKWRPLEPHYEMPFVHWLPKNSIRRTAIKSLLQLGIGKKYFPEFSLNQRADIINTYANEETFYRSWVKIRAQMVGFGFSDLSTEGMHAILRAKKPASYTSLKALIPAIALLQTCVVAGRSNP